MNLTKLQKRNLEMYNHYRSSPPTYKFLFRRNLKRYLISLALVILVLTITTEGLRPFAWIILGMFINSTLKDVGIFRRFIHLWPVTSAVLNWEQIDKLLADATE